MEFHKPNGKKALSNSFQQKYRKRRFLGTSSSPRFQAEIDIFFDTRGCCHTFRLGGGSHVLVSCSGLGPYI